MPALSTLKLLAQAAEDSYSDNPVLDENLDIAGYEIYINQETGEPVVILDGATGFAAHVWNNPSTNEYIVALRGTEFSTGQDWFANINLGLPQFSSAGGLAITEFLLELPQGSTVHMVGHSLGGALAQYFAYQASINRGSSIDVTLTTFNSLGGQLGGIQEFSVINPAILSVIDTRITQDTHFINLSYAKGR